MLMATQQELDDLDDLDGNHPMFTLILTPQTFWMTLIPHQPTQPPPHGSNSLMFQIPLQTRRHRPPLLLNQTSQTKILLANYSKGWNN